MTRSPVRRRVASSFAVAANTVLLCGLLGCAADPPPAEEPPAGEISVEGDEALSQGPRLASYEPANPLADLREMREAGELRVLVHQEQIDGLIEPDSEVQGEMALVSVFARRLDLPVRFILVPNRDELIPALLEGRGDLIADRLAVTPARGERALFSAPLRYVDEVVVVHESVAAPPKSLKELLDPAAPDMNLPHLRPSSAFVETLEAAASRARAEPRFAPLPERLRAADVLERVAQGAIPLTLQHSDVVARLQEVHPEIEVAFVAREERPVAWAMRPSSERLAEAINGFVFEGDFEERSDELYGGDLEQIRARGVLRVSMPNDSTSYFIHRGQRVGFHYELAKEVARRLGVRLEPVVVGPRQLGRFVRDGTVDLVAPFLTITPERERELRFTRPLFTVDEVLVQPIGEPAITGVVELSGRTVHLRPDSSHWNTLEVVRQQVPELTLAAVDSDVITQQLLAEVMAGSIPLTVADSHVLTRFSTRHEDAVHGTLMLAESKPLGFSMRADQAELHAAVDAIVGEIAGSTFFDQLYKRYFEDQRGIRRVLAEVPERGQISPYDDLVRQHARRHGLDWRFVAAQMYQESGFKPKARSFAGARGLLQVMPGTAREMGYDPDALFEPEIGIEAGVEYMARMVSRFDSSLPFRQRLNFALASYNAGYGHVIDARRLASAIGKDRNLWLGNVEDAIVLLEQPEYAAEARHGYCRGSEPRQYVRAIGQFYETYGSVVPAEGTDN